MNALPIVLLGLAAILAERGSRAVRRAEGVRRVGLGASGSAPTRRSVPTPVLWGALGGAVGLALAGPVLGVVGAIVGVVALRLRDRRRRGTSAVLAETQLADAVTSIAAAVRAGRSVPQAISFATAEAAPPLRTSLEGFDEAVSLGVPFDEALTRWSGAVDTPDGRLVAGVLALHRRSGGDLPSVLDGVARTLRERRAAAVEIRALTAQARLSGTILGVLPFGFFAFLWLTSRDEIEGALRSPAGLAAIALGLLLEGAAYLWIRHLLEVR